MTCTSIVDGRIVIRANGKTFEGKGNAEWETRNIERKAEPSASGRIMVSVAPNLFKFKITYANFPDAEPEDLYDMGCGMAVTIEETDRKFSHMYTNATVVGTPRITQGEVQNMEIQSDRYQKLVNP